MPVPTKMADLSATAASNSPRRFGCHRHIAGRLPAGDPVDPARDAIQRHARLCRDRGRLRSSRESITISGTTTINSLGTGFVGCYKAALQRHHAVDRLS